MITRSKVAAEFELPPLPAAPARRIGRGQRLRDQSFVAGGEGPGELGLDRRRRVDGGSRHHVSPGENPRERGVALGGRPLEERFAVAVEKIEEERGERRPRPLAARLEILSDAAHRVLERHRAAARIEDQRLAVEDGARGGDLARERHQLRNVPRHVAELPGVDARFAAELVELDADAVELGLDGGRLEAGERRRGGGGAPGEHRRHGDERLGAEARERSRPLALDRAGDERQIPAEHLSPGESLRGERQGGRRRVPHHRAQRPLAKLAGEEGDEELPLVAPPPRRKSAVRTADARAVRPGP